MDNQELQRIAGTSGVVVAVENSLGRCHFLFGRRDPTNLDPSLVPSPLSSLI
jgi:hypothetical protein